MAAIAGRLRSEEGLGMEGRVRARGDGRGDVRAAAARRRGERGGEREREGREGRDGGDESALTAADPRTSSYTRLKTGRPSTSLRAIRFDCA